MFVLVSHQFALTGRREPTPLPGLPGSSLGELGVLIFFVISGYLVTESWLRDPNPLRFAARRLLRILPGLTVVTLLLVFVLGPLVTSFDTRGYFADRLTWDYLRTIYLKIRYVLPGTFTNNPVPLAVNASLWTIPMEVQWYCVLAGAGMIGILRVRLLVLAAFIVFALVVLTRSGAPDYFRIFGAFFCAGLCLNLFRDVWSVRPVLALCIGAAVSVVAYLAGIYYLSTLSLLAPAVVLFGTASTPVIRRFGRFGDLSYGVYIYTFPIQQTLVWATDNRLSYPAGLALTASLVLVAALLSWHLVEKPALSLKRYLAAKPVVATIPAASALSGTG